MSITCAEAARAPFLRGVLALHSFFYDEATVQFEQALAIDRKCAMGYWGIALANGEQLWSWHDTTESRSAIAQAAALRAQLTPKEAALDDPEHAILALPAALSYAAVAPEAPHARHMPAHIFVELGYWADAAASCESAWQVSLARASRLKQTAEHGDLHSLSWLPSLYAQLGQRARADEALQTYSNLVARGVAPLAFIDAAFSVARDTDRWDKLDGLLAAVEGALPAIDARFARRSPDRAPIPLLVRASRAAALAIAAARRHDAASARRYKLEMGAARAEAEKAAPVYAATKTYQTAARAAALRV